MVRASAHPHLIKMDNETQIPKKIKQNLNDNTTTSLRPVPRPKPVTIIRQPVYVLYHVQNL